MRQLHDRAEAQALALAIVDTLPEPFLVLDDTLHLLAGSRCFYEIFGEDAAKAHGRSLFELSDGQWDIPGLRQLLMGCSNVSRTSLTDGAAFASTAVRRGSDSCRISPKRDRTMARSSSARERKW